MIGYCTVSGQGLWFKTRSDFPRTVGIVDVHLICPNGTNILTAHYGELRVYFDMTSWSVRTDGLIYTDKQWIKDFRDFLRDIGHTNTSVKEVTYSEQGMQGLNYVSLDVTKSFVRECDEFMSFVNNSQKKFKIQVI